MATEQNTRGGTHEQHVRAGEQSHKNSTGTGTTSQQPSHGGMPGQQEKSGEHGQRGGTHERHVKAGQHSHRSS